MTVYVSIFFIVSKVAGIGIETVDTCMRVIGGGGGGGGGDVAVVISPWKIEVLLLWLSKYGRV